MNTQTIISDINEAVAVIGTYRLACLVWAFEDCPLQEVKHYVPRGKEELVVVAHKEDKYLSFRLIYDEGDYRDDFENYRIALDFHEDYYIWIIINPSEEES